MSLFEAISLGDVVLRNRVMMAVHGPRLSAGRYLRYLDERSRDVGLVGLHAFHGVHDFPFGPGRYVASYAGDADAVPPHPLSAEGIARHDAAIPAMAAQVEVVHRNGAKCVGQLFHLGASQHTDTFAPAVAPSIVVDEYRRRVAHPLDEATIGEFVAACGHAARRARAAGMDGLEIHAAHGYLVHQFLSPRTNLRDDRYGGDLSGRMRLLIEILEAARAASDERFALGVRISGSEDLDDVCAVAGRLADWGVAFLNVSGGTYSGLRGGAGDAYVASSYTDPGQNVGAASAIRRTVAGRVPVIVGGRVLDAAQAERIVEEGHADMVAMVRALIADPRLLDKARRGRHDEVRRCVGGNECHYARAVTCAVNPAAGREDELAISLVKKRRRVVVVGGGPAGVECAQHALARGHHVTLFDERDRLGGTIRRIGRVRPELLGYVESFERRLAGVDLRLGERVDPAMLDGLGADVVVLATGATQPRPDVSGLGDVRVLSALATIDHPGPVGDHVVVVGGLDDHLPPLLTADWVSDRAGRVTLLVEPIVHGEGVEDATRYALTRRLLEKDVDIRTMSALHAVEGSTLVIRNTFTNRLAPLEGVDTIVLAGNRAPRRDLLDVDATRELIGDALSPRRLVHATLDGARVGTTI